MLLSVLASCAVLAAQSTGAKPAPPAQDPQQPVFRTRVDSISVDVTVTDRQGRPVTDLKAEDFDVRESGKPQAIESFRLIQIDDNLVSAEPPRQILSESDMARETANPDNRVFIILLDDYHTRAGNALHIRDTLARFVRTLTPHDLVALLYPLTVVSATTFSRDHEGTAAAIMQFKGRKYDYKPLTAYEEYFANQPPEAQEQIRNDITIRTLQSACSLLATLRDGRKTLLFVSEGMTANIPPGALTSSTMFPPRTVAPPGGFSSAQQSYEFFRSADLLGRMRDIFTVAARGNTSIYTLDPRGLAPSEFGAGDLVSADADRQTLNEAVDSLHTLADETGGKAMTGSNDAIPDLKKMVRELSSYYLLGYTSSLAPRDGKFHEIQVRVNRRDVDVHARKGYWAYTDDELKKAYEPPKEGPPEEVASALDTLAGVVEPTSRRNVMVWMGAVRGDADKAQVTLVWEATSSLSDLPADRVEQVSVVVSAGNDVVFRGPIPRDPTALRPSGQVTFAAPAGPIRVRVASENARGQKMGTEDVTDQVPDFTGTGVMIAAPQVFRARTARDVAMLRAATSPLPSAARQFSRTERLLVRFDAYGPAGTTPQVSMRLLNRAGQPLAALPAPSLTIGSTFEADLSLAALPPGDYLVEITATSSADKTARLLGIRVTG